MSVAADYAESGTRRRNTNVLIGNAYRYAQEAEGERVAHTYTFGVERVSQFFFDAIFASVERLNGDIIVLHRTFDEQLIDTEQLESVESSCQSSKRGGHNSLNK